MKKYILITSYIYIYLSMGIYNIIMSMGRLPYSLLEGVNYLYDNVCVVNPFIPVIIIVGMLFLYEKFDINYNNTIARGAVIGSFICNLGILYWNNYGLSMLTENIFNFCFFLIMYICSISVYYVIYYILVRICTLLNKEKDIIERQDRFDRKEMLIIAFGILFLWLPYFLVFFPGRISGDAMWAISSYINNGINDRHPVAYTYLVGVIMEIGRGIFDGNLGICLNILLQIVLSIVAIIYSLSYTFSIISNKIIRKVIILFFGICPIIPINIMTLQTDVIYCDLFLITMTYFMKNIIFVKEDGWNKYGVFAILVIITALFRKEGILVFLIALSITLVLRKDIRKNLIKSMFIIIPFFILIDVSLETNISSLGDSKLYKYSIFLQQVARYVRDYPTELTLEDKMVIDKIVDYEQLAEKYNPVLSDPIIGLYNKNVEMYEVQSFFGVWLEMFMKHPKVFVDAFINNCYGYFFPAVNPIGTVSSNGILYDALLSTNKDYYYEAFGCKHPDMLRPYILILESVLNKIQYVPIIGFLFIPATYVWIVLFLAISALVNKKSKHCAVLCPYLLIIAICLVSPANGHMRYLYGIVMSIPILFSLIYGLYERD